MGDWGGGVLRVFGCEEEGIGDVERREGRGYDWILEDMVKERGWM